MTTIEAPAPDAPLEGSVWTVDKAAGHVLEAYGRSVAAILDVGHRLYEAQNHLPPGNVLHGVRPADRWRYPTPWQQVIDRLPFGERSAARYIQVYLAFGQVAELDPPHVAGTLSGLPADVATLGILAQLPADDLPVMIQSGEIHAKLSRAGAQAIVRPKELPAGGSAHEAAAPPVELRDNEPPPDAPRGAPAQAAELNPSHATGTLPGLPAGSEPGQAGTKEVIQPPSVVVDAPDDQQLAALTAELAAARDMITGKDAELAKLRGHARPAPAAAPDPELAARAAKYDQFAAEVAQAGGKDYLAHLEAKANTYDRLKSEADRLKAEVQRLGAEVRRLTGLSSVQQADAEVTALHKQAGDSHQRHQEELARLKSEGAAEREKLSRCELHHAMLHRDCPSDLGSAVTR